MTVSASSSTPIPGLPPRLPFRRASLAALVLTFAACSGSPSGPDVRPDPLGQVRVQPLTGGAGTVTVPFSDVTQEYVLVLQSTFPNTLGTSVRVTAAEGASVRALDAAAATADIGQDAPIRRLERRLLADLPRTFANPSRALGVADDGPQEDYWVVNTVGTFQLNDPSAFDRITATRRFDGANVIIYVDERDNDRIPDDQIQAIGSEFDTRTYGVNVGAFGSPSDIDGNGKVVILLSRTVNGLTTPEITAQGARIIGFFFGIDLIESPVNNPHANLKEIFYAVIPNGEDDLPGARVTSAEYVGLMGSVFAHEFQHMINFNEHVLVRNASSEETWLDEGLSHMAEALNGYATQNRLRAAFFLDSPSDVALVGNGDGLDERGASYLFVQYLVDRFGQSILRSLVQTIRIGTVNVGNATGRTFATLFHEWATALLLDGPQVANDPIYEFNTLDLRSDFESAKAFLGASRIPGTFLDFQSASAGSGSVDFTLKGTSPLYLIVTGSGEGNVPISFSGSATAGLQVSVVRTR